MDFSVKHDGLERTPWFLEARHMPERDGTYETRAWKGAPDVRCDWYQDQWWTTDRLSSQLEIFEWRGITEASNHNEKERLAAVSTNVQVERQTA